MSDQTMGLQDCPFCAIVRGDEDSRAEVVCEGATWIAFFPLEPATPGHTLIISRAHYRDYWDLSPDLAADLAGAVLRVGRAMRHALEPEGMNLISSSGEAAEQTVFHLHIHLVPRWKRDGFGRIWPPDTRFDDALKANLADSIRKACGVAELHQPDGA